jgi:lipopolysaccharide export system permease protein
MIFRRVLLRELTHSAVAAFAVLMGITLTTQLIRFLGQAASGMLASEAVAAFLGFSVLNYLPVLLSLTLFMAVLMTLTRSYRDSEMIIWFSSGLSITAWVKPVLSFSLPIVLGIALLSLVLSPWAVSKSAEYQNVIDSRDDVSTVAPGIFKESKHTDRVYFVESFAGEGGKVGNVFMQTIQHQKLGVMVANNGYQERVPNGDRFLVLLNGRRYEGTPGQVDYRIVEFERYAMRVEPYEAKFEVPSAKSFPTPALFKHPSPENMGEWVWRMGLPLSALLLALLAIPLSFVNPRAGRSINLVLAFLIYMVYSNMLSISQAWVVQQKISLMQGMWAVHAGMALLLILSFYRRISIFSFFRLNK